LSFLQISFLTSLILSATRGPLLSTGLSLREKFSRHAQLFTPSAEQKKKKKKEKSSSDRHPATNPCTVDARAVSVASGWRAGHLNGHVLNDALFLLLDEFESHFEVTSVHRRGVGRLRVAREFRRVRGRRFRNRESLFVQCGVSGIEEFCGIGDSD
jgi:hypothetical protein